MITSAAKKLVGTAGMIVCTAGMVVSTTELIASALKKSISVAEMIYSEDVHVSIASCKNVIRGWQRAGVHRWKDALNEFAVLWEDRVQSATRSTDGIDKPPKS